MTTTPPPATRVRTPPTPLHGPKYDLYEPYSPRRSSRINSKRDQNLFNANLNKSPSSVTKPRAQPGANPKHASSSAGASTPQKRPTIKRTSSQHISPPSSPISPDQDAATPARRRHKMADRPNVHLDLAGVEPDSDADVSESASRSLNSNRPGLLGMLPTPAKTPKKRGLHDEVQLKSTARVLFPSRPATIEEAMPSPRKSRMGKSTGFALDSLDGDLPDGGSIAIYTDSKERIPEEDEADDSPFLVSRRGKHKKTAGKTKHGMTKEVDEAVERGEGAVYVFRGKKMFRRFEDANNGISGGEADDKTNLDNSDLMHRAGASTLKPLKRTSLKPRLLFPPKETSLDPDDEDEEAVTDIESHPHVSDPERTVTPMKQSFRPTTPPTTGRKRKSDDTPTARGLAAGAERDELDDYPMGLDGANDYLRLPQFGAAAKKKSSLYDTWPRTKPGVGIGSSKSTGTRTVSAKRPGEALERDGPSGDAETAGESGAGRGKRSRSGAA